VPSVTVVAALIRRGRRLLLTRREAGAHLAGKWEFPGGKVEPGESLEAALVREIQEELNVEVEVGPLRAHYRHRYPETEVDLHFFECRIREGEPHNGNAARLGWFLGEEVARLDVPEANRRLLAILNPQRLS
jgi:8-oxo-dGTP diphosphatase